ncbi:MAG: alpha/beta fold hydrolase [Pirellulales bacterium]
MASHETDSPADRPGAAVGEYEFPEFIPHPWLRSGHAQTIAGAYVPHRRVPYSAIAHTLELPDGDRTALHDDRPAGWQEGDPCVLLLHGLGGSHLSPYMVRVADKLQRRGIRAFRLDLRGHGLGWDWARRPGHAGRSEDARAAVDFILQSCPHSPLAAVGVSMGGNILLKLLGEWSGAAPPRLRQALAIAPPIDLARCSRQMLARSHRLYTRAFLGALRRQVRLRSQVLDSLATLPLPREPANLWEFDDWITAPLAGFRDADEYYAQSSACRVSRAIQVPTTILTAADDPLIPVAMFHEIELSAAVRLRITSHGGHVGFLGIARRDPDRRWLDWRIVEWVESGLRTGTPDSGGIP